VIGSDAQALRRWPVVIVCVLTTVPPPAIIAPLSILT
jgi:hypothetical protein